MNEKESYCFGCMEKYDSSHRVCPHCGYVPEQSAIKLLHLKPGTILKNRYIVGRTLGYGGYGVTYLGYDTQLERKIAIKEYLPSEFATRQYDGSSLEIENEQKKLNQFLTGKQKFLEEGQKLAQVSTIENVVQMDDCFEENETAYITMEYLQGQTLEQYLAEKGFLSESETMDLMIPLLASLAEIHEKGILHRDISPDNIFLTKNRDGKTIAKLIDFGAAKYATVAQSSKSLTVIVKKGYSPEEQYRSKGNQGIFSDVYAVGAVMYKMLTGQVPPDSLERRMLIETGKRDKLEPISKYNKDISANVETAILNALNVKVEDRTRTVADFVGELISFEKIARRGSSIRKIDFMKWPLWAKIGVPLASAFAIFVIIFAVNRIFTNPNLMVNLPDGMTRVPEFISSPFDDAIAKSEKAQLQIKNVSDEYTPGGKSDIVLTQDLSYGVVVPENSLVSVTVSTGKQYYCLPDVKGYDVEYARYALECMGLEVIESDGKIEGLADNTVINQSIEPYTDVNTGETITLVVNRTSEKGKANSGYLPIGEQYDSVLKSAAAKGILCRIIEKVFTDKYEDYEVIEGQYSEDGVLELTIGIPMREFTMPNLNYKNQDIAVQLLKNLGIESEVEVDYNEAVAENLVYSQDIKKGKSVKPNTKVVLQVSRGGKPFTMPSVIGSIREDAEKQLSDLKLAVKVEYGFSSEFKEGEIFQQSVDAGTDVRRGDEITIYVCSTESLIKVPSVTGKEQEDAKKLLEEQKLKVQIVETYDDAVKKGYVISQLPGSNTLQKEDSTIVLTISKGPYKKNDSEKQDFNEKLEDSRNESATGSVNEKPANSSGSHQAAGSWSSWTVSLPGGVTSKEYDIEEAVQYRSRNRQTTTSTEANLSGWTLYDQKESWSDYGNWSSWSTDKKEANESTLVRSKTQYSTRTRSTTESSDKTLSGWTLINTKESWSDYGAWSAWSTTVANSSESRKVELKEQYRYQDKESAQSENSTMSGWTYYKTGETWGEYGPWSSWSTTPVSENSSTKVEKSFQCRYRDSEQLTSDEKDLDGWILIGQSNTVYGDWGPYTTVYSISEIPKSSDTLNVSYIQVDVYNLYYYHCNNGIYPDGIGPRCTKAVEKGVTVCPSCGNTDIVRDSYQDTWSVEGYDHNGEPVMYRSGDGAPCYNTGSVAYSYYNYQTRTVKPIYSYYRYGPWSSWGEVGNDITPGASMYSRQVEKRDVYRYATRSKVPVYYFYRWGPWSSWSDTVYVQTSNRNVETRNVYRYCDRKKIYTYVYEKWSDWSNWGDTSYTINENRDVRTRTVYSYSTRKKQYTYYYEKWSPWSAYGTNPISPSANIDVQTRVVYRYRTKAK